MSQHQARWLCQLDCVCERQGVHRPFIPEPWRLMGHPLWLLHTRRLLAQDLRVLPLPCAWHSLASQRPSARRIASDGPRARHHVSGAENTSHAALPAARPCRWHLNTCVVQPQRLAPADRNHVRTPDRLLTTPVFTRREKNEKIRSQEQCVS